MGADDDGDAVLLGEPLKQLAHVVDAGRVEPVRGLVEHQHTGVADEGLGKAETLNDHPRQYMNRLSDLMFVLARVLNRHAGGTDVLWQQGLNRDG